MTPDVNVLVAASRSDHPHHAIARAWLEETLGRVGTEGRLGLLAMVTAGFLRVVSNKFCLLSPWATVPDIIVGT